MHLILFIIKPESTFAICTLIDGYRKCILVENSQNTWKASIVKSAETVHKLHELQVNKGEAYEGSACHLSPETQETQK